jgi:hypothetical protein
MTVSTQIGAEKRYGATLTTCQRNPLTPQGYFACEYSDDGPSDMPPFTFKSVVSSYYVLLPVRYKRDFWSPDGLLRRINTTSLLLWRV